MFHRQPAPCAAACEPYATSSALSSLWLCRVAGIYASDVVVQDVAFLNYYGAITMGALPQAMPVNYYPGMGAQTLFLQTSAYASVRSKMGTAQAHAQREQHLARIRSGDARAASCVSSLLIYLRQ